jgi:heme-degrading monooxygenase HmoA
MLATIVTFQYGGDFDRKKVVEVAAGARGMFEGMPGLRAKVFTVDEPNRRAVNFYVWESEDVGRGFFSDELREKVTALYGAAPTVDLVEIAELVDNA